jgi:hypothetical protein
MKRSIGVAVTLISGGCSLLLVGSFSLLGALAIGGCSAPEERWEKSPGVEVTVDKEYINGKPFMTVFYENFGADTIEKIRYQLITETKGKIDTILKEIDPPELLRPKDRHVVPRHIGEDTVKADEIRAGQVWVVMKKQ